MHKVTIVSRGQALGYTLNLPTEERYLHTTEEFEDLLKVYLAGRAAEQIVFGRVTNGAANDLERATELARAMVFDYGMSERRRRARCAPTTTRSRRRPSGCATTSRPGSPTRPSRKRCACSRSTARSLDRIAKELLEKETLDKAELAALLVGVEAESQNSETVGTVRIVAAD